ncbi:MAG: PA2779 family protein, partial [Gammaproteobacteria bacterium]
QAFLEREDVRQQLVDLGVTQEDAQARIALLTANELQNLNHQINTMPAGSGVLGVVGAVFVVLIILELVGVIDIFNMM